MAGRETPGGGLQDAVFGWINSKDTIYGAGIGRFLPAYFCQLVVILALIYGHQGTGLFCPASRIRIIKYTYIHRISYVY